MPIVTPTGAPCGAVVTDVDLSAALADNEAAALRDALDQHHVLVFPDQHLSNEELERFSQVFGRLGTDPWFVPIDGSEYIAEVRREADEASDLFADNWHSDWSFLDTPPVATVLYGVDIPPVGGDTLFANQHLAYERLEVELKELVQGLRARHTDRNVYGKGGRYHPDNQGEQGRSMMIVADGEHHDGEHPLVRVHEGNGRPAFYSTIGYIQGIVGMADDAAAALLRELYRAQTADEVVYRHRWQPHMVVVWDNRSVLHRATGGYDGYRRVLRRTTVLPAVGGAE